MCICHTFDGVVGAAAAAAAAGVESAHDARYGADYSRHVSLSVLPSGKGTVQETGFARSHSCRIGASAQRELQPKARGNLEAPTD